MDSVNPDGVAERVTSLLAQSLGVESEDISDDDSFSEDLHMAPDKLADFVEGLSAGGFETAKIEIGELETVGELIEALSSHEDIT